MKKISTNIPIPQNGDAGTLTNCVTKAQDYRVDRSHYTGERNRYGPADRKCGTMIVLWLGNMATWSIVRTHVTDTVPRLGNAAPRRSHNLDTWYCTGPTVWPRGTTMHAVTHGQRAGRVCAVPHGQFARLTRCRVPAMRICFGHRSHIFVLRQTHGSVFPSRGTCIFSQFF